MKDELGHGGRDVRRRAPHEITADEGEFSVEDLIADEDMVVTISHSGYIKRTSVTTYRRQRRGGKGLQGSDLRPRISSSTSSSPRRTTTSCSSPQDGRCFWLKVHEIPQVGRAAKGKPVVNLINVAPERRSRRWCR